MSDDSQTKDDTTAQDDSTAQDDNTAAAEPLSEADQLKTDLDAMTQAAKRAMADLQNFKRRTEEERSEIQIYANMQLLLAIFPAIDDLDRAMQNLPEELKGNAWVAGISAVQNNLLGSLTQLGLTVVSEVGVPLNPGLHEVLLQNEGPKDQVLQILEKGYAFKGKTLKPAKVVVGKGE